MKVAVTINEPPEKVWTNLMDADNLQHWLTGFISAKHLTGTAGEPGSSFELMFREGGREMKVTETVLVSVPNRQYSFKMEADGFWSENDIRLVSFGNRTELIQTVQFHPGGFFFKLLMPLMKGQMKKRTLNELMKLKNFIESKSTQEA